MVEAQVKYLQIVLDVEKRRESTEYGEGLDSKQRSIFDDMFEADVPAEEKSVTRLGKTDSETEIHIPCSRFPISISFEVVRADSKSETTLLSSWGRTPKPPKLATLDHNNVSSIQAFADHSLLSIVHFMTQDMFSISKVISTLSMLPKLIPPYCSYTPTSYPIIHHPYPQEKTPH